MLFRIVIGLLPIFSSLFGNQITSLEKLFFGSLHETQEIVLQKKCYSRIIAVAVGKRDILDTKKNELNLKAMKHSLYSDKYCIIM